MSHDGKYVVIHDSHRITKLHDTLDAARDRAAELSQNVGEDVYRAYLLVEVSDRRMDIVQRSIELEDEEFYVCPQHVRTGGYERCCHCGGWDEGAPDHGKLCTEAE